MSDPHSRPEDLPTFAAGTASGGDGLPTSSENAKTFADGAQTFAGGTVAEAVGVAAPLPATFGRYRILRLIGEGGMGAVYEAEQDQPRRTVALKVIKPGLASPELLRRFAQESQALGRLQHPGIAQIYDAGTVDTGYGTQPYFAMEFIRGETLRDYTDAHRLGVRQRLALFVKVCEAVHHAHQRGLIHRDLKPGNILVDENGQPKILDFGVARVTDSDAQATMQTDVGQLVGTLAYMSPEQVLADPLDIDIRSDVYALGVILYELLAGRLPYDISKRLHEALHTIREQDPSKLSSIDRRYRGDIETIAAKALEKDKTRRYASAAELAADVTRHLKDEPIVAQPPSTRYQLQKFARRHTALVAGVAAVFVVLVAGVVVSTWQAIRAGRAEAAAVQDRDRAAAAERAATTARDEALAAKGLAVTAEGQARQERDRAVAEKQRADTESATAKAVSEFLQKNLFEQVSGGTQRGSGPDLSVSGALDRAAARIDGAFADQPLVEAGVREAVARAYMGLSMWDQAVAQLDASLALRRRLQGQEDADTLKAMQLLGTIDARQRRWGPAEARMERVVDAQRRRFGADHPDTLQSTLELATTYVSDAKPEKAEPLAARVVAGFRRTRGPEDKKTIEAMLVHAVVLEQEKKFAHAQRLAEGAYASSRRVLGDKDSLTELLRATSQRIALSARVAAPAAGGPTAADRAAREEYFTNMAKGLAATNATSLPEMIALASAKATVAVNQGKPEAAVAPLVEAIDAARRAGQEELSLTAILAGVYALQKKFDDAVTTLAPVLATPAAQNDLVPNVLAFALRSLATGLRNEKRFAEAEPYFARLLPIVLVSPGEAAGQTRIDLFLLGDTYASQRKYPESERSFAQLLDVQRRTSVPESVAGFSVASSLGWAQLRQGRLADAERTFRDALAGLTRVAPDSWERFNVASMLGATLSAERRFSDAEPLLTSGYEGMDTRKPANANAASRFTRPEAGAAILQLYADWGNTARRAEWEERLKN